MTSAASWSAGLDRLARCPNRLGAAYGLLTDKRSLCGASVTRAGLAGRNGVSEATLAARPHELGGGGVRADAAV